MTQGETALDDSMVPYANLLDLSLLLLFRKGSDSGS